jgi:HSP20 family protein
MYEPMYALPSHVTMSGMDRFHHELESAFGPAAQPASIRSAAPGAYPAINISAAPTSVEVCAFAPGIEADKVDITVDKGVLTLSGERPNELPVESDQVSVHTRERAGGRFKRAVSLRDDVDIIQVKATYRDGMLVISLARTESVWPTRIEVQ